MQAKNIFVNQFCEGHNHRYLYCMIWINMEDELCYDWRKGHLLSDKVFPLSSSTRKLKRSQWFLHCHTASRRGPETFLLTFGSCVVLEVFGATVCCWVWLLSSSWLSILLQQQLSQVLPSASNNCSSYVYLGLVTTPWRLRSLTLARTPIPNRIQSERWEHNTEKVKGSVWSIFWLSRRFI